jgi:hypothetical protein
MEDGHVLTLLRSERALTDCRPISLFAIQTGHQLGDEIGMAIDKRRFRANIFMDLASVSGFAEDAFVGRTLRIVAKGGRLGTRARSALQDDHDRSRYGSA